MVTNEQISIDHDEIVGQTTERMLIHLIKTTQHVEHATNKTNFHTGGEFIKIFEIIIYVFTTPSRNLDVACVYKRVDIF